MEWSWIGEAKNKTSEYGIDRDIERVCVFHGMVVDITKEKLIKNGGSVSQSERNKLDPGWDCHPSLSCEMQQFK